jgi:NADPH:quinone reductase-like Zn-dependent oxidoreductase
MPLAQVRRDFRLARRYSVSQTSSPGGYAQYVVVSARSLARKPGALSFIEAASAPVVAVTAWQMLFEYGRAKAGERVLVHGGAGNVGAYAVQLANRAGLEVIATASARDVDYVRSLGAASVIDHRAAKFEDVVAPVDIVVDIVGGETRARSFKALKPTGILVSVVSQPLAPDMQPKGGPAHVFFIADVTTARLQSMRTFLTSGNWRRMWAPCCRCKTRARRTKCLRARRTRAARSCSKCRTEECRNLQATEDLRVQYRFREI